MTTKLKRYPDAKRRKETDAQLIRRIDRTLGRTVKNGGPTSADLARAISIKLRRCDG
jgi:hypothetical protein